MLPHSKSWSGWNSYIIYYSRLHSVCPIYLRSTDTGICDCLRIHISITGVHCTSRLQCTNKECQIGTNTSLCPMLIFVERYLPAEQYLIQLTWDIKLDRLLCCFQVTVTRVIVSFLQFHIKDMLINRMRSSILPQSLISWPAVSLSHRTFKSYFPPSSPYHKRYFKQGHEMWARRYWMAGHVCYCIQRPRDMTVLGTIHQCSYCNIQFVLRVGNGKERYEISIKINTGHYTWCLLKVTVSTVPHFASGEA